jgi:hypothetical protein
MNCGLVACYTNEMDEFLESNPGLKSRFEEIFEFEDYTVDELYEIACRLLLKQKLKQNSDTETIIKLHLKKVFDKRDSHFGNGRLVRHIVEDIIKNYDLRKAEELQNNGKITSDNTILPIDVEDLI